MSSLFTSCAVSLLNVCGEKAITHGTEKVESDSKFFSTQTDSDLWVLQSVDLQQFLDDFALRDNICRKRTAWPVKRPMVS